MFSSWPIPVLSFDLHCILFHTCSCHYIGGILLTWLSIESINPIAYYSQIIIWPIVSYCRESYYIGILQDWRTHESQIKTKSILPECKVILTYRHTHTQRRRGVNKKNHQRTEHCIKRKQFKNWKKEKNTVLGYFVIEISCY